MDGPSAATMNGMNGVSHINGQAPTPNPLSPSSNPTSPVVGMSGAQAGAINAPVAPSPGNPHYQHPSQAASQQQPQQGFPMQLDAFPQPGQAMQHPQIEQQQVAQQQPQSRSQQTLNGGWQSDKDVDDRRKMIAMIVQLLRQRKPNAPQEWLNKLPQMAKRLEESLYRSAPSLEAYNDISTLKQRLQQLAMNIGMKTKRMQQQGQPQQGQQVVQQVAGQPPAQPQGQPQYQQRMQPPMQQQVLQQPTLGAAPIPPQPLLAMQQPQQLQQQQVQMVNNPNMNVPVPQQQFQHQDGSAVRQPSDRQQVLRHQQQRLLLLRHAAKCPHQDNQCPVTPHCAGMKRLWKHIAECKDQKCLVPHCVSSRYVLSHYHRCKDVRCPVCGPVREAIHRSHEKQKQMQALKQGHQAALKQQQQMPGDLGAAAAPPNKRQKTGNGQYVAQPQFAQPTQAYSQQALAPTSRGTKAGYVYSQPPGAISAPSGVAMSNGKVIGGAQFSGPRPQEDHTLINCFTLDEIQTHIKSLDQGLVLPVAKLKTKFGDLLKGLQSHSHGWVFNTPVDPVELGLPDYFEVIEKPMDLGTVKKQLDNGVYRTLPEVERDVSLTFDNAMLYNPEGSVVWNMANELKNKFTKDFALLIKQLHAEEEEKRKSGDACQLCGSEKLLFEPPVFYCNGVHCRAKRIRRNSYFYVGGNNQFHWCQTCYDDLKESKPIELAEMTLRKSQLDKKKNNEIPEESWVQCDRCERWIHQICALFNTRQNTDQRSEFVCPSCTCIERTKKGKPEPTSTTPMAEDLPRTKLSEYLETHVRDKLKDKMADMAKEMAELKGIPLDEAIKATGEGGGEIYIRQVTSMSRALEVRPRMKERYSFKNYPSEFKYRCKCLIVFQNLDGVDVILFGLYVYEHDETNAPPNHRAVYVSYLDSVHYMRPRKMRTFVYHELLAAYLDQVRNKGYNTAHIWACPPLKGDDYILFAKPEDQKVPKDDRLRLWYIDMLKECQRRGIVGKMTNAYDLYFANEKNDATVLPYMEGDYFQAEMENIIKDMDEGKHLSKKPDKVSNESKKAKKSKSKAKSGARSGTRSSGLDHDALSASGILPEGVDVKSLKEGGKDWVMRKLGETIHPMKESFLVAFLNWEGQEEENMVVPKDVMEYREQYGVKKLCVEVKEEEKDVGDLKVAATEDTDMAVEVTNDAPSPSKDSSQANTDSSLNESTAAAHENSDTNKTDAECTKESTADVEEDEKIVQEDVQNTKPEEIEEEMASNGDKEKDDIPEAEEKEEANDDEVMNEADGAEEKKEDVDVVVENGDKSEDKEVSTETEEKEETDESEQTKVAAEAEEENETDKSLEEGETNGSEGKTDESEEKKTSVESEDIGEGVTTTNLEEKAPENGDVKVENEIPAESSTPDRTGKFAAMAKKKDEEESNPKPDEAKSDKNADEQASSKSVTKDSKGRLVKVIDDDEEELDCEFLNNRQLFLNLCQGNHYQFDSLRRAKHTSMMVLWHLHNRDAPKFVTQCSICAREILQGKRFHCPTCADFDQCFDCLRNPAIARHPHQLQAIPVGNTQSTLTAEQRKERQRSIALHMTLLLHASTCRSSTCSSANCAKMKGLLKHGAGCKVKANGGCNVCKRIWALLQIHARQCKADNCPVPNCLAIRERYRQLQMQQQAMDDRRRQMMNQTYHQTARADD